MKKLALHWQILIGMVLGVVGGLLFSNLGMKDFFVEFIKPIGTIFISLLKLIAIPLIVASLIKGVSDLRDISQFSKIGFRTIGIYIATTVIAITIGLIVVNIIKPGEYISPEVVQELTGNFSDKASSKINAAAGQQGKGRLQFIVDMVPQNIFGAMSSNGNMLQVIFFSIFFAISMLLIDDKHSEPVKKFFDGINEIILKMVDLIMLMAPYAVFALIGSLIVETSNPELFAALGMYALTVLIGLAIMMSVYFAAVYIYTGKKPNVFFKGIAPAQLLAFSTSSSAATLPVTMERVEEHLGVEKDVASFVLPVGATINMDGTSLYQAVAAVFICQALNFDISLMDQISKIVLTATMASIGSAAVPGAGMVMLVIVLDGLGLPKELLGVGLAMIFAVDRPLDMCRTTINVTGDASVSMIVAKSLNKLGLANPKNWDDNKENF